jgi:PBP superfamily domain
MKLKKLLGATVAAGALLGVFAPAASAAPEPTGWDDKFDVIRGGGSDTTYNFLQRLEVLYNQAIGCDTDNVTPPALPAPSNLGNCLVGASQRATDVEGNWDHDVVANLFPTGSGAGRAALQRGDIDFARSSSAQSGTANFNSWAFGKDAIVVVTLGNRQPSNLTMTQLRGIFSCQITNWNQINDANGNPFPSAPIQPVGMNSSSGTYSQFGTVLGLPGGAAINSFPCVRGLDHVGPPSGASNYPFENNVVPLEEADDAIINPDNAIWWMSRAEYTAFNAKRSSAKAWSIDGVSPIDEINVTSNSYPITRYVWHVTKDPIRPEIDPASAGVAKRNNLNVLGPDIGAQGAVVELTEFLCKPAARHTANTFTGRSNAQELALGLASTGFLSVPLSARNAGSCYIEGY